MAQGVITILSQIPLPQGGSLIKCSFPGDTAYPTGGTLKAAINTALATALKAIVAAATDKNVRGLSEPTIKGIIPGDCGQYVPSWVTAGLFVRDGGHATWDEVGNGTALNGTTFNVTLICE
jgi:hypothetical protein